MERDALIQVRVKSSAKARLQALADAMDVPLSAIVRMVLSEGLPLVEAKLKAPR